MSNIVLRIFGGFGVGALLTLCTLLFVLDPGTDITVKDITLNLLGTMISGAYFSLAAMMFNIERWSMLKQTVVHYTLSLLVLLPVFIFLTGWIPLHPKALLVGIIVFTAIYLGNWLGWYVYFKQIAKKMNESLQNKK